MNKWTELFAGLILLIGAILVAWYSQFWPPILGKDFNFWHAAWTFLKGGIFWFVVMIGALFILLGISDLKD
ncbi:hypothetical protein J4225_01070 [Candidatus Pacearchaeota archaeon]|nr:hypothetical protein [Candidatus Pacearchaeota archaeon]